MTRFPNSSFDNEFLKGFGDCDVRDRDARRLIEGVALSCLCFEVGGVE